MFIPPLPFEARQKPVPPRFGQSPPPADRLEWQWQDPPVQTDGQLVDAMHVMLKRLADYRAARPPGNSRLWQDAVARNLEVLGEAANQLSPEFRQANPHLNLIPLIQLRRVLVHQYYTLQPDRLVAGLEAARTLETQLSQPVRFPALPTRRLPSGEPAPNNPDIKRKKLRPRKRPEEALRNDMLAAIHRMRSFRPESFEAWKTDALRRDAVLRNLELLGEGALQMQRLGYLPDRDPFWKPFVRFRHALAHRWPISEDLLATWRMVTEEVPRAEAQMKASRLRLTG